VSQSTDITFEAGYRRLQDIAERLGSDEVPVHEMCDLFAEGKGLEQALADYLSQQKERVEAIERGEGMRAFRVVPPGAPPPAVAEAREVVPAGAEVRAARSAAGANGAAPGAANGAAPAAANGAAPAAASGSAPAAANRAAPAPASGSAPGAAAASAEDASAPSPPPPPQDEALPF
jgi:exodeoxyribonuclease VII small subunit